jgi:hypothetical protein
VTFELSPPEVLALAQFMKRSLFQTYREFSAGEELIDDDGQHREDVAALFKVDRAGIRSYRSGERLHPREYNPRQDVKCGVQRRVKTRTPERLTQAA